MSPLPYLNQDCAPYLIEHLREKRDSLKYLDSNDFEAILRLPEKLCVDFFALLITEEREYPKLASLKGENPYTFKTQEDA